MDEEKRTTESTEQGPVRSNGLLDGKVETLYVIEECDKDRRIWYEHPDFEPFTDLDEASEQFELEVEYPGDFAYRLVLVTRRVISA